MSKKSRTASQRKRQPKASAAWTGSNFCVSVLKLLCVTALAISLVVSAEAGYSLSTFLQKLGYKVDSEYVLKAGEFKGAIETIYIDIDGLTTVEKITDSEGKMLRVSIFAPIICFVSAHDQEMRKKMGANYDRIKLLAATRVTIFFVEVLEVDAKITEYLTEAAEKGVERKKRLGNYEISVIPESTHVIISAKPIN